MEHGLSSAGILRRLGGKADEIRVCRIGVDEAIKISLQVKSADEGLGELLCLNCFHKFTSFFCAADAWRVLFPMGKHK